MCEEFLGNMALVRRYTCRVLGINGTENRVKVNAIFAGSGHATSSRASSGLRSGLSSPRLTASGTAKA